MMYPTANGDCPIPCGYKTPYGKCGVAVCMNHQICDRCGSPKEFFYNAGMPVWGCKYCFDHTQIVYSDHISTEA